MGQNSSALGSSSAAVSPRNKLKPPRPSEPPKLPKIPNYVVPENKVIPNGVGDMENARKLLRPVSQELTKFHPDFADIFQSDPDPELDFLAGGVDDSSLERSLDGQSAGKTDSNSGGRSVTSSPLSGVVNKTPDPYVKSNGAVSNGHAPMLNNQVSSKSVGDLLDGKSKESNLKRTHSLERDRSHQPRVGGGGGHKRQASLTNGGPIQQPVIMEDPREHLYNITRQEPFSNLMPANASLPLKNSFELDYSLNLTYAQLAEYRRQQRISDLESKTGQKLKELGVEINAANTMPKSPFDRANLGAKAKTHSVSTGSSENGVSKSKKKKAPLPPPPPPGIEPPADYDMQDVSNTTISLERRNSSASRNLRAPPPEPKPKRMSIPTISRVERNQIAAKAAEINPNLEPAMPPVPPPPAPPPQLPSAALSTKKAANANNYIYDTKSDKQTPETNKIPGYMALKESVTGAKAQLELLKQIGAMLKTPKQENVDYNETKNEIVSEVNTPKEENKDKSALIQNENAPNSNANGSNGSAENSSSPQEDKEKGPDSKENYDIPLSSGPSSVDTKPSPNTQLKRMNSLLQHDIILAAQGQATKYKKKRQPPALEKPKDLAQVFREELQKAAQAREERRKEAQNGEVTNNNDNDVTVSSPSGGDNVELRTDRRLSQNITTEQTSVPNANKFRQSAPPYSASSRQRFDPESTPSPSNVLGSPRSSASFEEMSISSNNSQRVYSSAWTPEDDLEPDDDILQERKIHEENAESQGFKSSIVPMKIKDLKDGKEKKVKKNKYEKQTKKDAEASDENNKTKFGSIRRFKKNIHDNMKNVFGSIGRQSGKLMKKHKSQDFLNMSDSNPKHVTSPHIAPDLDESSNWEFVGDGETSMKRSRSDNFLQRSQMNGDVGSTDDSDNSDVEIGDIDFASGIDEMDKGHHTETLSNGKDESPIRHMKRAGVAYVSGTGQIIVLPEYNTVKIDANGNEVDKIQDKDSRAPKLFRKKDKKLKYESTVRMQERNRREEVIAREIREKENQIERERLRQQEIERDFRRLRDLDAQERLQRMQTDNILQQLTYLQQQQVRQAHMELNNTVSFNRQPPVPNGPLMNGGPSVPNLPTQANSLITISNVPQHQSYTHLPGSLPTQAHSAHPSNLTKGFLNQTSSQIPKMSPVVNTTHYTTHSAPIIGSTTNNSSTSANNLPNLSTQDLNTLSSYMKMMGVAPPVTQQQWAFLLSSVSINAPNFPGSHVDNTVNTNTSNGTDLSQLFGVGKTLESTVIDSKPTFYELIHKTGPTSTTTHEISTHKLSSILSGISSSSSYNTNRLVEVDHDTVDPAPIVHSSNHQPHKSFPETSIGETTTTTPHNDSTLNSSDTNSNDSPEERIDSLTSSIETQDEIIQNVNSGTTTVLIHNGALDEMPDPSPLLSPHLPRLPANVYGPIGFKPVSFQAGTT